MHGKCLTETPVINNDKDIVKDLNENQKHIQNIKEHFTNRWKREYLTELRERHKYVVMIHEDKMLETWNCC